MPEAEGELPTKSAFLGMPVSWVGWVSVALLILSVLEIFIRRPFGFRGVFATGIAAGVAALIAVLWKKERSLLVLIPLVAGAFAALVVAAEFAFPH